MGTSGFLVLGVAFKKDVDDARYSPAIKVIELLQRQRITVLFHDPHVPEVTVNGIVLQSQPLSRVLLEDVTCVLTLTDHSRIDYKQVVEHARLVFDARNATNGLSTGRANVIKL